MTAQLNQLPLVSATIQEPLLGVWFADVQVDSDADIAGAITMLIDGATFSGAVYNPGGTQRGGLESGRWLGRIVGGAAGLQSVVAAKNYAGVNVRAILDDILRDAGETLDATNSASATLIRPVSRWHRMQSTAGTALRLLLESIGSTYRMQRDGTLFVGEQSFDAVDETDMVVESTDPSLGVAMVAPLAPTILPGVSFTGRPVSHVTTKVAPGGLRQEVWFSG